jgi:hypothetical protein
MLHHIVLKSVTVNEDPPQRASTSVLLALFWYLSGGLLASGRPWECNSSRLAFPPLTVPQDGRTPAAVYRDSVTDTWV